MERLIVWHRWLPPGETGPEVLAHARAARERARAVLAREGAQVIASPGGTLVCAAEPAHIVQIVEACLSLLRSFDESHGQELGSLSIGLAVGALPQAPGDALLSDAVDRAQALANRARPGELVLDADAHARIATTFLFARELSVSAGIHGEVIDRAFPTRRECRACLARLATPTLPSNAQAPFQSLRQVALARGRHRVLVMGPYGAGVTSWLSHLAREAQPALWLHVSAVAAPLAPLSGLAFALRRLHARGGGPELLLDPKHEPDRRAIHVLAKLRDGCAVSRRDAITALRHLIVRVYELHGKRVWISVSPVPLVDPASVGAIADAVRDCPADHLLVLRMALDSKPPEALTRGGGLAEIRLPALTQPEARALAQSMLGKGASNDIARRAAAMGGPTPLGVAEAVRVLVSSGDVVHDGEQFRWRRGPAGRVNTIPVEEMIEERVDQLEVEARRVLEILASVPDPAEDALVHEVAQADGLSASAHAAAVAQLRAEGLVERHDGSLSITSLVRSVVEQCIPPVRLSQLNRSIAEALARRSAGVEDFAHATRGYYLARGGDPEAAVEVLLEAARNAGQLGFIRSGVRLAAAAVECDPSGRTRERAAQIAHALSTRMAPAKKHEATQTQRADPASEPAEAVPATADRPFFASAMQQAIEAIVARDFDGVERCLELLVAAGKDGPAVDRLRAMTLLSKGDQVAAMRALDRARQRAPDPEHETPRAGLAMALVLLEGGQVGGAIREAMRALGRARALGDARGEEATLHALAACYKRLGRLPDAASLAQGARAVHGRADLRGPAASGSSRP